MQDHLPTNLALYGSAYVGLLAALVRPTNDSAVPGFDLLATDYHHGPAWPTTLLFNPSAEAPVAVSLPVPPSCGGSGGGGCTFYDAVAQAVVARAPASAQSVGVTVGADAAAVIVAFPTLAPLEFDAMHRWLVAGGAVVDWAASGLPAV